MQRIANETQAYYLLGYMPTNTARDGKFRKIQVKLADGRGLQVRARKGYYAPSDTPQTRPSKKGVDPVIQGALDSPWAQDGIPLRMTRLRRGGEGARQGRRADRDRHRRATRSTSRRRTAATSADLQFLLVVAHRESGEFFRYDQGVNMKLQPATRERLSQAPGTRSCATSS